MSKAPWQPRVKSIQCKAGWDDTSMVNLLLDFIDEQPEQITEELVNILQERQQDEEATRAKIAKLNWEVTVLRKTLS